MIYRTITRDFGRIWVMDHEGRSSEDQRAWPLSPTPWERVRPQLLKFLVGAAVILATIWILAPYLG
jgi:hypothetical protein